MAILIISGSDGGHIWFAKMPPHEILHTLRKLLPEAIINSNQPSKKSCTTFPPELEIPPDYRLYHLKHVCSSQYELILSGLHSATTQLLSKAWYSMMRLPLIPWFLFSTAVPLCSTSRTCAASVDRVNLLAY